VGIDSPDGTLVFTGRKKTMGYPLEDFSPDGKRCCDQAVEGLLNGALRGILHGDDAAIGFLPLYTS